ncbi:MAG TPA: glycoside hydrolase family 65 protein [Candidatus Limnocylindria bacterium]
MPAYLSNGLVGLRVSDIPLLPGLATVSGFVGLHPAVEVEAAATAPYPIAGDIAVNRVWLTRSPQQAEFVDQAYDFASGELTTRFRFVADGVTADVEVLTFCSRTEPTVVCQELSVTVNAACQLTLRALVEPAGVSGRMTRRNVELPGTPNQPIDGSLRWDSLNSLSQCGIAYATDFSGAEVEKQKQQWGIERPLATDYQVQARRGRRYRLRQMASLVPSVTHHDPDREAARLAGRAAATGFDGLRAANRQEWDELWRGRILVDADDDRWQQFADAAFYYLNASVHRSSPASTSIFGLAQWHDYHYYYGHVMWDIEAFSIPPLLLVQPDAAESMLEYRFKVLPAARMNAKLNARRGLQFAWESGPLHGDESMPGAAAPAWYEDHISLDVALAFAQFAHATGDEQFLRSRAAPVLYGVVDWLLSRAQRRGDGFAIPRTLGIGERSKAADNDAFTVMSAKRVLAEAIDCARALGDGIPAEWMELRNGLEVRRSPRSGAVMTHDGFHPLEEKGSTPDPLAGLFPGWYQPGDDAERDTIDYFLDLAPDYIGSPMLSPLYGVWAAWRGDRQASARLLEQGYADLVVGRFLQTLEHLPSRYPEKAPAGPFFAHLGALLETFLFGLPGIRIGSKDPATWPERKVVLPAGWRSIESERVWIKGRAWRMVAKHGAQRALLEPIAEARQERAAV